MSYQWSSAKKIFSGVKGYDYWMKTVIKINQFDKNEVAQYRLKVIEHYERFGLASTLSAYPVARSTLFLWRRKYYQSKRNLLSLVPLSTRPKNPRRMVVHPLILEEIERLRKKHYRLGKLKLKPLLDQFCQKNRLKPPSVSLIGKIIKRYNLFYQRPINGYHDPGRKKHQARKKIRVKKAPQPEEGGYIQGDTVETITPDWLRRYTISFIDVRLKIGYSKTFTGKLSKYALECFKEFEKLLPKTVKIKAVQTDNGSEFEKDFNRYLEERRIKHLWTYPQCPKVNSVIERYNRSIQEEWMNSYLDEIDDPKQFNQRLREYLYFYNNQRVHESLGLKTPAQVVGEELICPKCP
jgi:transposase InsO family protein